MAKPINGPTAHRYARAEVVGYPEPVLAVIRDLVREIQADPELALGSGLAMDVTRKVAVVGTGGRPSGLQGALADLVIIMAGVALEGGAGQ
jgi:hypothetical protein